jgi:hypothetical protein
MTSKEKAYLDQVKYTAAAIVTSVKDFESGSVNSLELYIGWLRMKIRSLDSLAESLTFELSQKEGAK